MEKQKRYNGSMERVGESLTAEAEAVTYSFLFSFFSLHPAHET